MNSTPLLENYLAERNQLLGSITDTLEKDPSVKAAWLFGSLGRGDEDALSDIDLWIIGDDDHNDHGISQLRQYISQIANPILVLEAPQNAPEGGAYLMACYDAPVAPHFVDWYWQPQSLAFISGKVRLLFEKVGVTHQDKPMQFAGQPASKEILESPLHFIGFFWVMLMITAKEVSRSPWAEEMELLPLLINPLIKAQQFLDQDGISLFENLPSHRQPGEKMQLLYQFADQMSEMMAIIASHGEEIPVLIKPGAYRYLKFIESTIKDKERY